MIWSRMKQVVQQKNKFKIIDFDQVVRGCGMVDLEKKKRHGPLFPNHMRCIICGPSGCGKTNLLFNMLFDRKGIRFSNIYVWSKTTFQPKYKLLRTIMQGLGDGMDYIECDTSEEIPAPNELPANSIIIFDDVISEQQDTIRQYFSAGRHSNVDVFYLAQTYSRIPKQLIRDNANFIIVFEQDELNMKHLYRDHVGADMTFDQFKVMCNQVWSSAVHAFLVIDRSSPRNRGRYRNGLDTYLVEV